MYKAGVQLAREGCDEDESAAYSARTCGQFVLYAARCCHNGGFYMPKSDLKALAFDGSLQVRFLPPALEARRTCRRSSYEA